MAAQKVCVVFGFGAGIGAACARKWLTEGFKVAVCSRSLDKLNNFTAKYNNNNNNNNNNNGIAKGYQCDVTDRQQMEATVQQIESELGAIHTMVYNAGNACWKTYKQITDEEFDSNLNTNVKGLFIASQLICPKMEERGEGVVAVTGATASLRGKPFTAAFAPSKSAQRIYSQALARDLGPKNVHVFYVIVDGIVDKNELAGGQADGKLDPNAIADTYWSLAVQPKSCWTFEVDVRPNVESW